MFTKRKGKAVLLDTNTVDGMAYDEQNNALRMLLTDPLEWTGSLSEHEHLSLLQEKINNYIAFIEDKQYKSVYPDKSFREFVIEIHFKYDIPENCKKFLGAVDSQLNQTNIKTEHHIS